MFIIIIDLRLYKKWKKTWCVVKILLIKYNKKKYFKSYNQLIKRM